MNRHDGGLSPETLALLARGRDGHVLPEARRRDIKRSILAHVAAGGVLATATSAAAWTTLAAKVVGGVAIVAVVGGAIHELARAPSPTAPPPVAVTEPSAPAAPRVASQPSPPPSPFAAVASTHPVPSPRPVVLEARTDVSSPPAPVTVPPVDARPIGAGFTVTFAPLDAPVVSSAPVATPSAPAALAAPSSQASLEAQARLLRDADRALKAGGAPTCLRLLGEHARLFPASALEPERSAERVLALCGAGRTAEAKGEARAFLSTHADGPLASRVRASCASSGE